MVDSDDETPILFKGRSVDLNKLKLETPRKRQIAVTIKSPETIGQFVKMFRQNRNWTQDQLAAFCGVTRNYISKCEIDRSKDPLSMLKRLWPVMTDEEKNALAMAKIKQFFRELAG